MRAPGENAAAIRASRHWPLIRAFLLLLATVGTAAAEPRRVLLIHSFGAAFPPFSVVAGQFREHLIKTSRQPIDLYEVSLETARFKEAEDETPLADHLRALFKDRNLDLVVVNGSPANRFFQRHRATLFPSTPLLIMGTEQRNIAQNGSDTVVVPVSFDLPGFFSDILSLLPWTESVAVVIGNSPLEKTWTRALQRELAVLEHRVKLIWLNELSFDEVVRRVSTLPPHSAIFYMFLITDVNGVPYEQDRALRALHAAANAPMFSHLNHTLGLGIVGGAMVATDEHGRQAAAAAVRVLDGQSADDIRVPVLRAGSPTYDWRELRRWGIGESQLPPDSIVEFRQPTAWMEYRWQLMAAITAVALQSALIAGLLLERRRRLAAELASRHRIVEVAHLNRTSSAGIMSASIAHELNQPLGSILLNTETADMLLQADELDRVQLGEIIADIRRDEQRAATIIRGMSGFLRKKTDVELQQLDLNETLQGVLQILEPAAARRGVVLIADKVPVALPVRADHVHLQQVILNLAINAMDAMQDMHGPRTIAFRTRRSGPSEATVRVSDNGPGIPDDKLSSVFERFYTTKQQGSGLGLSIARTIVEFYGGRIRAESRLDAGATFIFTLPLAADDRG